MTITNKMVWPLGRHVFLSTSCPFLIVSAVVIASVASQAFPDETTLPFELASGSTPPHVLCGTTWLITAPAWRTVHLLFLSRALVPRPLPCAFSEILVENMPKMKGSRKARFQLLGVHVGLCM